MILVEIEKNEKRKLEYSYLYEWYVHVHGENIHNLIARSYSY